AHLLLKPQRAARRRQANRSLLPSSLRRAAESGPQFNERPMTTNVLILCTHNSARSVLGEGMLNHWARKLGKDVRAFSAGSTPGGRVNPFAIEALTNAGIDVSGYRSKS